jgi:predicted RNA-binding Zn-ribbon protein involved in translation (DUF1610 family)
VKRRAFLAQLPAAAAAVAVAPTVSAATPERARAAVVPVCPRCGLHVAFERRSRCVGDLLPVACSCGWRGVSPESA